MKKPIHTAMLITLLTVSTFCNCYYFGIPFQLESTGLPSPKLPDTRVLKYPWYSPPSRLLRREAQAGPELNLIINELRRRRLEFDSDLRYQP
jgi:hypothetical protein